MINIGAFIEFDKKINNKVLGYKKKVKNKFGNQIYLDHPVHSTLFTIKIKKISELKKIYKNDINIKNLISSDTHCQKWSLTVLCCHLIVILGLERLPFSHKNLDWRSHLSQRCRENTFIATDQIHSLVSISSKLCPI